MVGLKHAGPSSSRSANRRFRFAEKGRGGILLAALFAFWCNTMTMFQIREARDSDASAVIDLIAATYLEYPDCRLDVEADEPQLLEPASYYKSKGGNFWVAETERGSIVGSVAFVAVPGGFQLYNLYVASDIRGSGLAHRLFEQVRVCADEREASNIILWTDTRFERAHRFYERLGFKRGPMLRSLADESWSVEYFYRMNLI